MPARTPSGMQVHCTTHEPHANNPRSHTCLSESRDGSNHRLGTSKPTYHSVQACPSSRAIDKRRVMPQYVLHMHHTHVSPGGQLTRAKHCHTPLAVCMSAIEWSGFAAVYYGTSIPYLLSLGLHQVMESSTAASTSPHGDDTCATSLRSTFATHMWRNAHHGTTPRSWEVCLRQRPTSCTMHMPNACLLEQLQTVGTHTTTETSSQ